MTNKLNEKRNKYAKEFLDTFILKYRRIKCDDTPILKKDF